MGKNKLFQYSNEVKLNLRSRLSYILLSIFFFQKFVYAQRKKKIQKLFNYFFVAVYFSHIYTIYVYLAHRGRHTNTHILCVMHPGIAGLNISGLPEDLLFIYGKVIKRFQIVYYVDLRFAYIHYWVDCRLKLPCLDIDWSECH